MGNCKSSTSLNTTTQPQLKSILSEEIKDLDISATGPHKIKPLFLHSARWRCTNSADFAYINKLRPKLLSRINFANMKAQNIGRKALRSLTRVFVDAKRFIRLNIKDSELSAKQVEFLLNSINHFEAIAIWKDVHATHPEREIPSLFARLTRNKGLLYFETFCYFSEQKIEKIAPRLQQKLKQLSKLQSLFLNRWSCEKELLKSPLLSRLSFNRTSRTSQQRRSCTLSNIVKSSQIGNLWLLLDPNYTIKLQEAQLLTSLFQNSQLQTLLIHFFKESFTDQDEQTCEVLSECFKHSNHLTTFKLTFSLTPYNSDSVSVSFFANLKYLTQLQKLLFEIDGISPFTNIHTKSFASALELLQKLRVLEIILPELESPSKVVKSLAQSLRNLSGLKYFTLKCKNPNRQLSYKALTILSETLAHFQLKSLNLTFFDFLKLNDSLKKQRGLRFPFKIKDRLAPLFQALSRLSDLSTLTLDHSLFEISAQGFKNFSLALKNLHKLSSFSLALPQLNPANDFQGLPSFLSCFRMMPSLNSLQLIFTGENISHQEIEIVVLNLKGWGHLSRLDLTFKHADQLNENSLNLLQEGLANLLKLEHLGLQIWKSQISNNLAFRFLPGLIFLKRLKDLLFEDHKPKSADIKDKEHSNLPRSLKGLENLKYLTSFVVNDHCYI